MSADAIHTEKRGICTIEIHPDNDCGLDDLRGDDEYCGILLYANFGRYGNASTPTCAKWDRDQAHEEEDKLELTHWIWPVYAYIHGGITISMGEFSCPWDSGRCGFVAVSREKYPDQDKARKAAESCVKGTDDILTGQVYGYVVKDEEGEEIESCWGFVSEPDGYVLEEARRVADHYTAKTPKQLELSFGEA